jgi:hypothetical protein
MAKAKKPVKNKLKEESFEVKKVIPKDIYHKALCWIAILSLTVVCINQQMDINDLKMGMSYLVLRDTDIQLKMTTNDEWMAGAEGAIFVLNEKLTVQESLMQAIAGQLAGDYDGKKDTK